MIHYDDDDADNLRGFLVDIYTTLLGQYELLPPK